jgi:hypothetical protein
MNKWTIKSQLHNNFCVFVFFFFFVSESIEYSEVMVLGSIRQILKQCWKEHTDRRLVFVDFQASYDTAERGNME